MSTMAKVSASQLAARRQYLDNLDSFLDKCQADVVCLLDTLGWTPDNFMQVRKQAVCPYNSGHRMPPACLEQHKRVCQLTSQGCSREDADKILDDSDYFYEGASAVFSLKLDKELMNSALWNYHMKHNSVYYGHNEIPLTQSHEEQMLSREDRLGLAEYIVLRARAANKLKELGPDELQAAENMADGADKGERQLTVVEEMAALRDFRRRRQTYRAKNVHITKKSHTEIMREVITNQMEMYSQSLPGAQSVSGSQSMSGSPFVSGSQSASGAQSVSGQVIGSQSEACGEMDKEDESGDPATTDRYKVEGTFRDRPSDRNRGRDRDRGDYKRSRQYEDDDRDDSERRSRADDRSTRYDDDNQDRDDRERRSRDNDRSRRCENNDRDGDEAERRRRNDDRHHRSRSKRSRSRSRQSSRSRSRDRHRSKHRKKHKKHKHRHRDSSSDRSGMDTETPKQIAATDVL